jgi:DNA-binding MarR family transcriptional regulator
MATNSKLADEIRQTRPFRNAAVEATLGILRTATQLRREFAQVVDPSGITPAQYNVLRILRGAGAAGIPTLVVRDRLLEEAPGITRLLDKLEVAGLVRRERTTPDRRQVMCYITPKGLALLKKLDPIIGTVEERCGVALSAPELRVMIDLLDRVREGIQVAGKSEKKPRARKSADA